MGGGSSGKDPGKRKEKKKGKKNTLTVGEDEDELILSSAEIRSCLNKISKGVEDVEEGNRYVWLRIEGLTVEARNPNYFIEIGRLWGEVVVTDPCPENAQDWSYGKVCVMTKELDSINETVIVSLGNKELKVRVKEVEDMVFQPCRSNDDRKREVGQEEEFESEEEERLSEAEVDSSENFSDDEDEGSIGDSFVKDSSPEIDSNFQMMMSGGRLEGVITHDEVRETTSLDIGNLGKKHGDIEEKNKKDLNGKDENGSPKESNKETNKQEEAQVGQDKDVSPEGGNKMDSEKRLDADFHATGEIDPERETNHEKPVKVDEKQGERVRLHVFE
ncbi:hypothetical protein L2E82_47331 [Cichorium intybus]|uniref:Uncharacterized protein n=1 Tax=Cichorium intybus TaxID=13427 RepID=A0ACB8YVA9_CICIN|nr:hypothetical protein L2E82_47331 [Cichorium intybus]